MTRNRWGGTLPFGIIGILLILPFKGRANPESISPKAILVASSEKSGSKASLATDGIIGIDGKGEWVCEGYTEYWGYIRYPWLRLEWQQEQSIDRVVLYDRPTLAEHTAGGTLEFSDGTKISVTAIPNNGSPKTITFSSRKVKWIKFTVTDGDGKDLGLSEIEVFPSPEMYNDPVSWVDPFIETTRGRYFFFSTGSLPFGMLSAAPVTRNKNQWGGGYNYNSTEILGFGQIHCWMLSGFDVMPVTGNIQASLGRDSYKSEFSHEDEIAQPGYHRVYLKKYGIWVEQTSTDRVGFYRMRYTQDTTAQIIQNLGGYLGGITMTQAQVAHNEKDEIYGHFITADRMWGGPKEVKIYFVLRLDKPYQQIDGWRGDQTLKSVSTLSGDSIGVSARYHVHKGDVLQMKTSFSFVSIENARENMDRECSHWDFDTIRENARAQWNQELGKIEVSGGSSEQRTKFYTDLWHVLLGRHKLNDISGDYPDYTQGKVDGTFTNAKFRKRTLPLDATGKAKFNMYNSDAFWLTQWNLNILWGLGWPEVLDDFAASLIQYADNGGLLPRGPNAGGYSYIMTGCPATNLIVSAYMKDILKKADPHHSFDVMKRNHMPGGMMGFGRDSDLKFYIDHGWCPENAGITVEWAFQDWSLAQMAAKLGKTQDYKYFHRRSEGWRNLYHPNINLLFPKTRSGEWTHTDPLSGAGWIEANAWQGTWGLSHDINRLSKLMGGDKALSDKLNFAFEQAEPQDFVYGYGGGFISYANQPGCSDAHVFSHVGKPWLTQYWVRKVGERAFGGITPDKGYGGHDEDQGQMGGVSALMAIGLFDIKGNNDQEPVYEITSPVFDEVTIHLNAEYYSGSRFTIRAYNNSERNMYIQKAMLNGAPLDTFVFKHRDFALGGTLELWMGPEPNMQWGVRK